MVRPRFDYRLHMGRDFVATKAFTFHGRQYSPEEPFDKEGLSRYQIDRLYGSRHISFAPEGISPVELVDKRGGNYEITAPWLDEPIKVRGKARAEDEFKRVKTEGPPLGFIAGGSVVTVEELGGGWYAIKAPWLDQPEKAQGRAEAERVQQQLHTEGEPEDHHGVALTVGQDGIFTVTPEGGEPETFGKEDKARERAAELRTEHRFAGMMTRADGLRAARES